jgi:DNA-binding SARP family transcriptional activator/ABC-type branched-subunit amino acid transport system substrate-binding protein
MGEGLSVGLLGPLEVAVDGAATTITSARQRAILALLALDADTVVPADRIIEAVWGETQPADPAAALHTQVSRLRALLGTERIVTREPGYLLDVAPEQVDVHRFSALLQSAADAPPRRAEELLGEALALWRGPALADLGDAPFASDARRGLEESRRDALEARGCAWVELGRRDEAIRELRALVDADPYRERAWAALILALYRNGRQAEALDAYGEVRRFLATQLGLEPGPALQDLQAQVLAHDPALAADARPPARRRRRWVLAGAGLGVAAGAAVTAIALSGGGAATPPAAGQVLRLDAVTGEVRGRFAVGRSPGPLAVGAGATWVIDTDAQTITSVGGEERTFSTGQPPLDVMASGATLYVGTGAPAPQTQIAGPVVAAVQRVAPSTQTVRATTRLGHRDVVLRPPEQQLARAGGGLWTVRADGSIARIGRDDRVTATVRGLQAIAVAAGPAGLWGIEENGTVARIDPRSARVVARTTLAASSLSSAAVGNTGLWVTAPDDGVLWRVPEADVLRAQPIRLARGVRAVALGGGAVWVANPLTGTLARVDERSARVTRTVQTGGMPQDVAVAGDELWASVAPGPGVAGGTPGTIAGAKCEPAVGRPGVRPDVLLTSDLPLQGGVRVSTQHMTEAIAAEVRARGFRAGRFDVAYISCDDSIARTGIFDQARCAANARAYTSEPRVLGVVGALNSPCTRAALRELPLSGPVYVSPLSTDPALTRPPRPRPFARVIASDEIQGAGLALLARRIGASRVYVADDGDPDYGGMLADAFTRASARTGVRIVGSGSWDPRDPARAGLGRAAARVAPDAVVIAGTLDNGGVAVLRELRRALGPDVRMLLVDGFTPTNILARRAGRAAEGAYLTVPGGTLDALTPSGRRFARRLRTINPGAATDLGAFYAAQATSVLLDAIARSDGSRASVLREVRQARIAEGLLGPVRFDAAGDIVAAPVSVLRVRAGDRSRADFEDTRIEQVLRPPASLTAP